MAEWLIKVVCRFARLIRLVERVSIGSQIIVVLAIAIPWIIIEIGVPGDPRLVRRGDLIPPARGIDGYPSGLHDRFPKCSIDLLVFLQGFELQPRHAFDIFWLVYFAVVNSIRQPVECPGIADVVQLEKRVLPQFGSHSLLSFVLTFAVDAVDANEAGKIGVGILVVSISILRRLVVPGDGCSGCRSREHTQGIGIEGIACSHIVAHGRTVCEHTGDLPFSIRERPGGKRHLGTHIGGRATRDLLFGKFDDGRFDRRRFRSFLR